MTAERSFSKLELIKTYLRSLLSEERLDGLAMLLIENVLATNLNKIKLIEKFSHMKARKVKM